ncbi:phosphonoacetate hydrolase [Monaibacterium marinum]|uniref:Phosphonoacetate hydrolase n=1 Tax=Pontivivens marinum TaxID=1690039 RepID=A0A2C9CMY3_9RHOB|nr:alkylphosphonate utilization protein [Monaibacterium marinum]SOH92582.1 phosphonoacetate hydrolase [Monaibacterium marinum]
MALIDDLLARADGACELCRSTTDLTPFALTPPDGYADSAEVLTCAECNRRLTDRDLSDPDHWRALENTMWTPIPPVQVVAWRILSGLSRLDWAADLKSQLWLDEETQAWAQMRAPAAVQEPTHRDSNGAALADGDTVTLIKDLNVKGSSQTAKRGTAVRGISLVADNGDQIEGRVNGERIVILTQFVKKQA